ncbi:TPA: conjugal transfer protein [Streptococcus agalactiae]|nr:conjugal transfer protein [Streptococcus agalactiae]HEN7902892.1 conjugal transfer protein [Streptococcus agalactiae]
MASLKHLITSIKDYLSHFQKVDKKTVSPQLKQISKKQANRLVLGGLAGLVLISLISGFRAISLSNKVTHLQKSLNQVKTVKANGVKSPHNQIDKRLEYYLNDYVWTYFTVYDDSDKQAEQEERLNHFYLKTPDQKAQGQVRYPSEIRSAKLLTIKDQISTYQVTYKETKTIDKKTKTTEKTVGFNVPYQRTREQFYVSGLPWYSALEDSQANPSPVQTFLELSSSDDFPTKKRQNLNKFLTIFFDNYTSNQDNLNLIAKKVTVLPNTKLKTIDYTYFKKKGQNILAYVQVTFDSEGSTHPENFTLTLEPKGDSYFVTHLDHQIPIAYAQ